MGQVKQALLEVEDFVCGWLRQGRTLKENPYLIDEDLIENKYYQFKGAEWWTTW